MNGQRIVVTRAAHQADQLVDLLRGRGAKALVYPCIAMASAGSTAALDTALQEAIMGAFDWLVLTSANTVPVLARRLTELGLAPAQLAAVAIAAVGPATSEAVQHLLGLNVHVVPDEYQAAALAEALRPALPARVLVVQADIARPILVQHLAAAGGAVTPVSAYRTVPGSGGVNLPALLATHAVDAITFTSSSSVHNCLRRVAAEGGDVNRLATVCLACIGPVTAQTVQDLGFAAAVVPAEHTLEGLVAALDEYFRSCCWRRRRRAGARAPST